MGIVVLRDTPSPRPEIRIAQFDAELIDRIRRNVGHIEAIRVVRWLTRATLIDAKRFVDALRDDPATLT